MKKGALVNRQLAYLGGERLFDPPIPFVKPFFPSCEKYRGAIQDVFNTGMLTKGKYLKTFERRVSCFQGGMESVAVSSGTQGLVLTLEALGIGVGDEILVPSFTFCATVHAITRVGAKPVFTDCDPETLCIDPVAAAHACTERTKAILAVHVFGVPADVDALAKVARDRRLALVFDAAHAFGTTVDGKPIGVFGDASVFSTSPTKTLVTGEGGLVVTPHKNLADRIRLLRECGNPGDYNCIERGTNSRLSELASITGLMSLDVLDEQIEKRVSLGERYRRRLGGIEGISLQKIPNNAISTFKDMPIILHESLFPFERDLLAEVLNAEGIPTKNYFDPPVHLMSCYQEYRNLRLPETERVSRSILCLPMNAYLTYDDVDFICSVIEEAFFSGDEILRKSIESV